MVPQHTAVAPPSIIQLSIIFIESSSERTTVAKTPFTSEGKRTRGEESAEDEEEIPFARSFEKAMQEEHEDPSSVTTASIDRQRRLWLDAFYTALRSYYRECDLPTFSTLMMDIFAGYSHIETKPPLQQRAFRRSENAMSSFGARFSGPPLQYLGNRMEAFLQGPRAAYLEERTGQAIDLLTWLPEPIVEVWFRHTSRVRDESHLIEKFFRPLLHAVVEHGLGFESVTTDITYIKNGTLQSAELSVFLQDLGLVGESR